LIPKIYPNGYTVYNVYEGALLIGQSDSNGVMLWTAKDMDASGFFSVGLLGSLIQIQWQHDVVHRLTGIQATNVHSDVVVQNWEYPTIGRTIFFFFLMYLHSLTIWLQICFLEMTNCTT
jgi:hypothetical protein